MIMNNITNYLDSIIPNPKCELNYNKDYELLIAVMLSAQTTDKRVNMVTAILFDKYKDIKALKDADVHDIENIIKPIGTYHIKAKNIIQIASKLFTEKNGIVPNDRKFLETLPGVGRKTTNVVLSNLFNTPCIAVDTHVSRVSKRLGIAKENDDVLTIEKKLNKTFKKEQLNRLHHQLVLFGRYKCKSKNPECITCPFKEICNYYKKKKH